MNSAVSELGEWSVPLGVSDPQFFKDAKVDIEKGKPLQKLMAKHDNNRRAYYTHYTGKQWGDSKNYHLTLDSGILGEDLCVKLILEAARAE